MPLFGSGQGAAHGRKWMESCLKELQVYGGEMVHPTNSVPTLYVDFNEMLDGDLVLLSQGDTKTTADGRSVSLYEGMPVRVYMDDADEVGPNNLVASGYVELNRDTGWSSHVKWCCRIDSNGIRHEIERP